MRNSITAALIIAFIGASGSAARAGSTTALLPVTVTVVHGCKHSDDKSKSNGKTDKPSGEERQENRGDGHGCGTIKTESFTLTFSFLSGVHVPPVISKDGKSGTTIDF